MQPRNMQPRKRREPAPTPKALTPEEKKAIVEKSLKLQLDELLKSLQSLAPNLKSRDTEQRKAYLLSVIGQLKTYSSTVKELSYNNTALLYPLNYLKSLVDPFFFKDELASLGEDIQKKVIQPILSHAHLLPPLDKSSDTLQKLNDNLCKVYADFFNLQGGDKAKSDFFVSEMRKLFSIATHEFLIFCMNLNDGIGDYVSLVFFIERLEALLKNIDNVKLRSISLVSDQKLASAKFAREDKIAEDQVFVLGKTNDKQLHDCRHIVGVANTDEEKTQLNEIFSKADLLWNFALGLIEFDRLGKTSHSIPVGPFCTYLPDDYQINSANLKQDVWIESWTQYQFFFDAQSMRNHTKKKIPSDYEGFVISEHSMGMCADDVGLRFIDNVVETAQKDKMVLFHSMSEEIKDKIFHGKEVNPYQYIKNNSFAGGYLQDDDASHNFVRVACLLSPKKGDMNILVNGDFFSSIKENTFSLKNHADKDYLFLKYIADMGFTQIEVAGLNPIPLSNSEPPRVLRLINFRGISEQDKICFYGLSEMVSASGDTSFSELVSTGLTNATDLPPLPFIQRYVTGPGPTVAVIEELKLSSIQYKNELIQFLEDLDSVSQIKSEKYANQDNLDELHELKNIDLNKVAHAWREFCFFLYAKRNEVNRFNELIIAYTFHHALKNNRVDECIELAKLLKPNSLHSISLLHLAVIANKPDAIRALIQGGIVNIDKPHPFNQSTALHLAIQNRNLPLVKLLIEMGANTKSLDANELTPLMLAKEKGYAEIVSVMKAMFSIPEPLQSEAKRPKLTLYEPKNAELLYLACVNRQLDRIKQLVQLPGYGHQATAVLYLACAKKNLDLVKEFLKIPGIDITLIDSEFKFSLLHIACQGGHPEIIELLLQKKGIDPNQEAIRGITPFYIACQEGNLEAVEVLLKKDIKINQPEAGGATPALIACQAQHAKVFERLLQVEGIEINQVNGLTALMMAAKNSDVDIVKLLFQYRDQHQKQIKVNETSNGITALMLACDSGDTEIVKLLVKMDGIEIDKTLGEMTALLFACASVSTHGKNELFRILLENKANLYHKNEEGQTAFDLAFSGKNDSAMQVLLSHANYNKIPLQSIMSPETYSNRQEWDSHMPSTNNTSGLFQRGDDQNQAGVAANSGPNNKPGK